ncbi:NUDIX hydrolase domain [Fusarium agapanthi]|uniref:NUDIX hydrolase domain n=1 Tax=Fusarium agapanthi TaxID=1803897 RepID=A0A9P5EF90_9HYPO|nr:NUDIX hydrolase domain [Fusarium agapanthi]
MGYLTYESDSSVADFAVSKQAYLTSRPERADTDDDAGKWEPPGGACDDWDKSILSVAVRELHEEAGLDAEWIGGPVDKPHFFTLDDAKRVCQFHFLVSVDMSNQTVKLSPDEHQRFVWATED